MNILAALCFLVAIILFVLTSFYETSRPHLGYIAGAFVAAGLLALTGFHF